MIRGLTNRRTHRDFRSQRRAAEDVRHLLKVPRQLVHAAVSEQPAHGNAMGWARQHKRQLLYKQSFSLRGTHYAALFQEAQRLPTARKKTGYLSQIILTCPRRFHRPPAPSTALRPWCACRTSNLAHPPASARGGPLPLAASVMCCNCNSRVRSIYLFWSLFHVSVLVFLSSAQLGHRSRKAIVRVKVVQTL